MAHLMGLAVDSTGSTVLDGGQVRLAAVTPIVVAVSTALHAHGYALLMLLK